MEQPLDLRSDPEPDWNGMVPVLDEYIDLANDLSAYQRGINPNFDFDAHRATQRLAILGPAVASFANRLTPSDLWIELTGDTRFQSDTNRTLPRAVEARALLELKLQETRIYKLVYRINDLHPLIANPAAIDHLNHHRYRNAVDNAVGELTGHLRHKLGRNDDGTSLFETIFSHELKPTRVTLRLPHDNERARKSWNLGANALGKACALLIRNDIAHNLDEMSALEAFESLILLSSFARLVDQAELVQPQP